MPQNRSGFSRQPDLFRDALSPGAKACGNRGLYSRPLVIVSRSIVIVITGVVPGLAFGWLVSGRPEKAIPHSALPLTSARAEAAAVSAPQTTEASAEPTALDDAATPTPKPHVPVRFGTPEFDAALRDALNLTDFLDRRVRIREILSDATLEQLPAIYEAAKKLPSMESNNLIHAIGEHWAEIDPRGAIQFGLDHEKTDGVYALFNGAESKWLARAPAEAAAWVQALPPGGRRNDLMSRLVNWLDTDPQAALQILRQQGLNGQFVARAYFSRWASRDPKGAAAAVLQLNGGLGRQSAEGVAKSWAEADPSSAIAWAAAIPSAAMRKHLVGAIAEQWAQSDPGAELDWARNQSDPQIRRKAVTQGLGSLAVKNLPAALEQINAMPSGEDRNGAVEAAALAVSASDARNGLRLIELLPAGLQRDGTVSAICGIWGQKEPRTALDWLLSNAPSTLGGGIQEILRGWAGSSPDQAIAWAQALPAGDNQDSALAAVVGGLATSNVTRAESIFQQSSPEAQKLAAPVMAKNLIQQGVDKARDWAESIPSGPAQTDAFGCVAAAWGDQNPTAAAQWLGSLAEGKARDAAISGFAGSAFDHDPEGAVAWAQSISDPRNRDEQIEQLVKRWLRTDSQAARAWLDANPQVTPEEKSRILEN